MLGKKPKGLVIETPPFPDALAYLWTWFAEVVEGVASNGFGPAMVTWRDLAAWSELTMTQIEPFEARALIRLSLTRAVAMNEDKSVGHQDKG